MALANERAGYVSSPLPSVAGQVEVAPGGAGGRARACGGESGRVTVVTDHLSVRGEAGREGKGGRLGSVPFPVPRTGRRSVERAASRPAGERAGPCSGGVVVVVVYKSCAARPASSRLYPPPSPVPLL